MTNDQLNSLRRHLAEKVMGWTWKDNDWRMEHNVGIKVIWHPDTDIAQAIECIKTFRRSKGKPWRWTVGSTDGLASEPCYWAEIHAGATKKADTDDEPLFRLLFDHEEDHDATPALAICLAVGKATGFDPEGASP